MPWKYLKFVRPHGHGQTPLACLFLSAFFIFTTYKVSFIPSGEELPSMSSYIVSFIPSGEELPSMSAHTFGKISAGRIDHTGLHSAEIGEIKFFQSPLSPV